MSTENITPEIALQKLKDGNQRFIKGNYTLYDHLHAVEETAGGQQPFAAILGCIDSRVPAEVVFNQGIGDIFNVRIAGNFINDDILGSLEFACKVSTAKFILVMGHSKCGAIAGAIDDVQMGNLTGMLGNIRPVVEAAPKGHSEEETKTLIGKANVNYAMEQLKLRSSVLTEMLDAGEIGLAGAYYDVETGKVEFL